MEEIVALAWPAVILILGLAFISLLAVVAWRPDRATPPAGPVPMIPPEIAQLMAQQHTAASSVEPQPVDHSQPDLDLPEIE